MAYDDNLNVNDNSNNDDERMKLDRRISGAIGRKEKKKKKKI